MKATLRRFIFLDKWDGTAKVLMTHPSLWKCLATTVMPDEVSIKDDRIDKYGDMFKQPRHVVSFQHLN